MYRIDVYLNPKGRTPQAARTFTDGNKRNAIRRARRELRAQWTGRDRGVKLVRVAVRSGDKLLYQARIDEDSVVNGYRRMIRDEEL